MNVALFGTLSTTSTSANLQVYHECVIDPAMPEGLDEKSVRACSGKNTVSDCPDDYAGDESTRELCG